MLQNRILQFRKTAMDLSSRKTFVRLNDSNDNLREAHHHFPAWGNKVHLSIYLKLFGKMLVCLCIHYKSWIWNKLQYEQNKMPNSYTGYNQRFFFRDFLTKPRSKIKFDLKWTGLNGQLTIHTLNQIQRDTKSIWHLLYIFFLIYHFTCRVQMWTKSGI